MMLLRQRGFTLIEMMVVLVVIGIMVGTMVLSINTDNIEEHMEIEMNRLNALVTLAQEESILQGQVMALAISENKYRFEIRDIENEKWVAMTDDRVFRERTVVPGAHLVLVIEEQEQETKKDFKLALSEDREDTEQVEDDDFQRLTIEPSGDMFPFELIIRKDDESVEYKLVLGEDGELKIIYPEELG